MMRFFFWLLSLVLVTASSSSSPSSTSLSSWSVGKEYRFTYNTQVLTGIPHLQSQYAGVRLALPVRLQPITASDLKVKIDQPHYQTYNDRLTLVNGKEAPQWGEDDMEEDTKQWLEKPFVVYLQNGIVQRIEHDPAEPQFVVNIKKGFVSQLQLDMGKMFHIMQNDLNQVRRSTYLTHFTTMEESVGGNCEVNYNVIKFSQGQKEAFEAMESIKGQSGNAAHQRNSTSINWDGHDHQSFEIFGDDFGTSHDDIRQREIQEKVKTGIKHRQKVLTQNQQQERFQKNERQRQDSQVYTTNFDELKSLCEGKEYFEVIKTKNLQKCTSRPIYEHSFGARKKVESSLMPAHSSVTRTVVCGSPDQVFLRKVTTENHAMLDALGQYRTTEKLDISSYSVLTLSAIHDIENAIEDLGQKKQTKSLIFEYPSKTIKDSSSIKQDYLLNGNPQGTRMSDSSIHASVPDILSSPHSFLPSHSSTEELKQEIKSAFLKLVTDSTDAAKGSVTGIDIGGLTVNIAEAIAKLSFAEIEDLESTILAQLGGQTKTSPVMKVFYDLVSISGSNPAVKLVIERTKSEEMTPISWEWALIVSNAIRSMRIPSEQILQELVGLLKQRSVSENVALNPAITLTLTNIVNKACLDPVKAELYFPTKIYGQFCSEDSDFIKRDLLPHLSRKLYQSRSTDLSSLLTYVNAIGNLNLEDAVKILLKVVEGRFSSHSHPRSLAVYKLIAAAQVNPSKLRPIFQAVIEDPSENAEVRIAAVAALTHSYPSSADLQRLAVRTWYENSEQVASYIFSSLTRLANLTDTSQNHYLDIKAKAKQAIPLAKPDFRLQTSKIYHQTFNLHGKNVDIHQRFQLVFDHISSLPKAVHFKGNVVGVNSVVDDIDYLLYVDGGKEIVNQINNLYQKTIETMKSPHISQIIRENTAEIVEKLQSLKMETNGKERPQMFLTTNYLGLWQLYGLDSDKFYQLFDKMTNSINAFKSQSLSSHSVNGTWEHRKVIDFHGHSMVFPMDSGLSAFVSIRNPASTYSTVFLDASNIAQKGLNMSLKHVANLKSQVQAGIACPIARKILAGGVETETSWTLPDMDTQIKLAKIQVHVKVTQSQEASQDNGKMMLQHVVQPYTAMKEISSLKSLSQFENMKAIRASQNHQKKAWKVGRRNLGQDMSVEADSDVPVDVEVLAVDVKHALQLALSSAPTLRTSSPRARRITVWRNPSSSAQALDVVLSAAYGNLKSPLDTYEQQEFEDKFVSFGNHVQKQSMDMGQLDSFAEDWKIDCSLEVQKSELKAQKLLELRHQSSALSGQSSPYTGPVLSQGHVIELSNLKRQFCLAGKGACEVEHRLCLSKDLSMDDCKTEKEKCIQREKTSQGVKLSLKSLRSGKAFSVSVLSKVEGQSPEDIRKYELALSYGHGQADLVQSKIDFSHKSIKPLSSEERKAISGSVKTVSFDMTIEGAQSVPKSRWDRKAILNDDPFFLAWGAGIYKDNVSHDSKTVLGRLRLERSDELKEFAQQTLEAKLCDQDERENNFLSDNCKMARQQLSQLDKMGFQMTLPSSAAQCPRLKLLGQLVKGYISPYLNEQISGMSNPNNLDNDELSFQAMVSQKGDHVNLEYKQNSDYTLDAKNVPLQEGFQYILPVSSRDPMPLTIVKKLSDNKVPSTCTIENNKVITFDNVQYEFSASECEYIILSERSTQPRVYISLKHANSSRIVTVVLDGQRYIVDFASSQSNRRVPYISVNGIPVQVQQGEVYKKHDDPQTQITRYEDDVYSIYSSKYGLEVKINGQAMEIKAFNLLLKNQVMGLCGDMNDEKTADIKSPGNCIMSSKNLAAMSFIVDSRSCSLVSPADRQLLRQEEKRCQKSLEIPTKVFSLFEKVQLSPPQPPLQHLVQEKQGTVCFSKSLVKTCSIPPKMDSFQDNVTIIKEQLSRREVKFVCLPKSESGNLKRRAEAGDTIADLQRMPVAYKKTIYEPIHCN